MRLVTCHLSPVTCHLKLTIINTNAAEIESIVRRVLATLTGDASSLGIAKPLGALMAEATVVPATLGSPAAASALATLRLVDQVVSLQSLKNRIGGIQVLEIGASAVLTPAARDFCRELRVAVVRGSTNKTASDSARLSAGRLQRILVVGTAAWMPSIAKQLCNQQANVGPTVNDDSLALRTIAEGIRSGHQAAVAIVQSPHAVCWQAARDDRLRPAVVSNWPDLNDVLQQVPANLLILSLKTWNAPSVCNCVRRFHQHLQNQS